MPDSGKLSALQNWLQTAVTTPWQVSKGEIDTTVKAGGALTPAERVGIYSRAYQGRLVECMESEFPVLLLALGRDLFVRFASEYLVATPSTSYTLTDLGRGFPAYLASTAPDEAWAKFIVELATFERAFSEVFHAVGHESESRVPSMETDLIVQEPGSQMLSCAFPVNRYFTAARIHLQDPDRCPEPEIPEPDPTEMVLFRRDYRVRIRKLN